MNTPIARGLIMMEVALALLHYLAVGAAESPPGAAGASAPGPVERRPGLVGAWYGNDDLTNLKDAVQLSSLEKTWGQEEDYGNNWSARWEGFVVAPVSDEVTFQVETDKRVTLEVAGRKTVAVRAGGSASVSVVMRQGDSYPITVAFHNAAGREGRMSIRSSWSGRDATSIPATNLWHSVQQERAWNWQPPEPEAEAPNLPVSLPVRNLFVYREPGRFAGWPANNGVWSWGNEILVSFTQGYYKTNRSGHSIDPDRPSRGVLARSLDGGGTWTLEVPEVWPGLGLKPTPCPGNLDFTRSGFAVRVAADQFFVSTNRGRDWQGPYAFAGFDFKLTSRTDYLVQSPRDCLVFLSGEQPEVTGSNYRDRAFAARTTDGGATFKFLSWMTGEPLGVRSVMPATVRTAPNRLVSVMRRKVNVNRRDVNWLEASVSQDNGASWRFLSRVAETDRGGNNGNPPALLALEDGRLVVAYGYRGKPFGIRAKLSADGGRSWGEELVLRNDAASWDFGYPRMVLRPDGKIVTLYYYHTAEYPEQHIAATIWTPPPVH